MISLIMSCCSQLIKCHSGGRRHRPTEREPSTAILRFFKISPVIVKNEEGSRSKMGRWKKKRDSGVTWGKRKLNVWTAIGCRFISGEFSPVIAVGIALLSQLSNDAGRSKGDYTRMRKGSI
jgi:hypothetical protein